MSDAGCELACRIVENSEAILDNILGELDRATSALNQVQTGDVAMGSVDTKVNILGTEVEANSPSMAIRLSNVFDKLTADKAARIEAQRSKMTQQIDRYNS